MPLLKSLRPTVRKRLGRWVSYLLAAVIVVVVALVADWGVFARQFANLDVAAKLFPQIVTSALVNTLWYTVVSFVVGTALAIVFAIMKLGGGPFGWFARVYIELFRGIPALLTIFACAFMVPIAFGVRLPGGTVGAGLIGLILVTSAYMAEIIRAGIQAVPVGQREAARSLGMTSGQTMLWVILPQGVRIVIPPMTNEFVMLLKDTSLLFIAGVAMGQKELTTFARDALSTNANATPMIAAALLYLIITVPLTMLAGKLEKMAGTKQ